MEHDAWFFVGVFVFIFLVWAATGGPTHPIAFTGPGLAQPQELGGGTYLGLPRAPFKVSGSEVSLPGSSFGRGSTISLGGNSGSVPGGGGSGSSGGGSGSSGGGSTTIVPGVSYGQASLYRGLVSMNHYVSGAGSIDPKNEYIQISVSQNAGVPVDLTGWTLMSEATGKSIMIPRGTAVPTSGIVNAAQDIILGPGDQAYVISGQSPIGASFRENKCIGYFSSFQNFSPSLPLTCPTPSDELSTNFGSGYIRDARCIDYVNAIPRCQVTLSPPTTISGSCQSFVIKYLNYNGCVAAHQGDVDFEGSTWHIYLARTAPLWRSNHEVIKLLDIKGKTVDAFSY